MCAVELPTGKGELPLRLLDYFSLVGGKRGSQLTGLEALDARGGASLTLRGVLLAPGGRAVKRNGQLLCQCAGCIAHTHVFVAVLPDASVAAKATPGGQAPNLPPLCMQASSSMWR